MNASRFDALVKNLGMTFSRRRLLAGAAIAGPLVAVRFSDVAAVCIPVGSQLAGTCSDDTAAGCCSGFCFIDSGICCQPSGDFVLGSCGVDAYGCCSGFCDQERQVCCSEQGSGCYLDSDCCGYIESPAIGTTYAYCASDSRTCQATEALPPRPTGGSQLPSPIALGELSESQSDSPSADPSLWVSQLSTARSNAETLVTVLKQNLSPSDPLLLAAQLDYGNVKASFDGWIDGFKYNISHGTDETATLGAFQAELKNGLELADHFYSTYRSALTTMGGGPPQVMPTGVAASSGEVTGGGPVLGTIIEVLISNLPMIVEQGKSLYNEYRSGQNAKKEEILNYLESLRWKSWATIV